MPSELIPSSAFPDTWQTTSIPSIPLPAGSGPRHLAFHPNGQFAYVLGELDSTVTVLAYEPPSGTAALVETISTLPENFAGENTGAEILVTPGGKFVYASSRGHDSLAIFAVNAADGRLQLVGHQSTLGQTPRHFTFDPTGRYLIAANQDSDSLVVFEMDEQSGHLTQKGAPVSTPTPVCIQIL